MRAEEFARGLLLAFVVANIAAFVTFWLWGCG